MRADDDSMAFVSWFPRSSWAGKGKRKRKIDIADLLFSADQVGLYVAVGLNGRAG
jgi:hypothetical protein